MSLRLDKIQSGGRRDGKMFYDVPVARIGAHFYGPGERGKGSPPGVEYRDHAELLVIAQQLPGKPLTLRHAKGRVARGDEARISGEVISGRVRGDFALADFRVDDDIALAAIAEDIRQLSLGYDTDPDSRGYQRNTRVDHLALVKFARCGSECSIRVDHCGCGCGDRHDGPTKEIREVMSLSNARLVLRMS